ncbi:MAG: nickel-dependent lactate racemase [Actinobacteria bacterium]|nr:nickel-dependent lactate racemase [Actinomycetota bacterium]MBM3712479.1 nickel-dependent lactate racemase [Actinomycetota bacterium]
MTVSIKIPWSNWYANELHTIWFPDKWNVCVSKMADAPKLKKQKIYEAIKNPIGSQKLEEIAKGKDTVGILVDDLSRPTPAYAVLPYIINELKKCNIKPYNISIIISLGAHRPMTKQEIIKKVGERVASTIQVLNHNPFSPDLVYIGKSKIGSPISINRKFAESDFKIAIGSILPHYCAGFGGGAKSIIPGIGGIDTLEANHSLYFCEENGEKHIICSVGNPDNPLRLDMEDIAKKVGLDFIINVVINSKLEIAGVFAGDQVKAHRIGCEFAKKVYHTKKIAKADVVIINAFPKDTEYCQSSNAFNVIGDVSSDEILKGKSSTIIMTTAASEGPGFHYLSGPGTKLFKYHDYTFPPESLKDFDAWIYSPNLFEAEIRQFYKDKPKPLYNDWNNVLRNLILKYGDYAKVAIYPLASIQILC